MLLSGLWHGAGWTFVMWGAVHGTFIVINHQWRLWVARMNWNLKHWVYRGAGVMMTFTVVSLAWTFFRAPNIGVAGIMLSKMLALDGFSLPQQWIKPNVLGGHLSHLGFRFVSTDGLDIKHYDNALGTLAFLLFVCWALPNTQQLLGKYLPILEPVARTPRFQITLGFGMGFVLGFLGYLILRNSYVSEPSPFIYFNF
jgi:alginate O-acetyltransferase complex protein AlgI